MGTRWKILAGLGAIGAATIGGLMLVRPASKGPEDNPQPPPAEPNPAVETDRPLASTQQPRQPARPAQTYEGPARVTASPTDLITNWEDKVDQILIAEGPTDAKARQMLEMFPRLPEAGQVEVARHLSNLVPDQDYEKMGQLLANAQLPPDVLDLLMADALNRPNSLKLAALLEVARSPQHPKAADAKEVLGFFLEADYGDDWPKWQEKVQEWLKENPD